MALSALDKKPSICIAVLIGLPAAGKTTFAQRFVQEFLKLNYNVIHVCYDDFIDHTEQAKLADLAEHAQNGANLVQKDNATVQSGDKLAENYQKSTQNEGKTAEEAENLLKWKSRRREIVEGVETFLQNLTGSGDESKPEVRRKLEETFHTFP